MSTPSVIAVIGGGGRMGREVLAALVGAPELGRAVAVDPVEPSGPLAGNPQCYKCLDALLETGSRGLAIDVSLPDGAADRIRALAEAGWPLVEGTTGLDAGAEAAILSASRRIPLVRAPNFSPGVALLRRAVAAVLRGQGSDWEVAVLDRHHRAKKDAPSGTARLLGETIRDALGRDPQIASFRQGGVVGEHVVHMASSEEELVFTHRAFSRGAFARGALLAAAFAREAAPGLYAMDDVLGLSG